MGLRSLVEVVALTIINYNRTCGSVAVGIGDSTIHTHTHVHTQCTLTIFAYIHMHKDHSHTHSHKLHTLTCNVAGSQHVKVFKELSSPHSLCQCCQTYTVFHVLWDGLCHYSLMCSMHKCACVHTVRCCVHVQQKRDTSAVFIT